MSAKFAVLVGFILGVVFMAVLQSISYLVLFQW